MNESFGSNLAKAVITRIAIFVLAISVLSLCLKSSSRLRYTTL